MTEKSIDYSFRIETYFLPVGSSLVLIRFVRKFSIFKILALDLYEKLDGFHHSATARGHIDSHQLFAGLVDFLILQQKVKNGPFDNRLIDSETIYQSKKCS